MNYIKPFVRKVVYSKKECDLIKYSRKYSKNNLYTGYLTLNNYMPLYNGLYEKLSKENIPITAYFEDCSGSYKNEYELIYDFDSEVPLKEEAKTEISMYPHLCPKCGAKAYVGFIEIVCSSINCKEFKG